MTRLLLTIPNLGTGGAQNVFRDQLAFYSKHFKTIGCVFNWDGCTQADRDLGLLSLDVPGGSNFISKAWYFAQRVRKLRKIKAANDISLSISHLEGADYVNLLSKQSEKTVCWIHGTKKFDGEIRGVIGWIRKKILMPVLYKKSDRIVTVSEGIRLEMIDMQGIQPSMISTIHNGFNIGCIRSKMVEEISFPLKELAAESPLIVTHCRLAPQKNLRGLIEIYKKLKDKTKAKLVIVGDGELRETLTSQAVSTGMQVYSSWRNDPIGKFYDIYFVGYQPNPYPFLGCATIYVMTSSWEGFPLALGEALVCGVPSIAADCFTGPGEILAPGVTITEPVAQPHATEFGILMPLANSPAHIEIWASTICDLLNDEVARVKYSIAAKRRIAALDQVEVNKKWLDLVNE